MLVCAGRAREREGGEGVSMVVCGSQNALRNEHVNSAGRHDCGRVLGQLLAPLMETSDPHRDPELTQPALSHTS